MNSHWFKREVCLNIKNRLVWTKIQKISENFQSIQNSLENYQDFILLHINCKYGMDWSYTEGYRLVKLIKKLTFFKFSQFAKFSIIEYILLISKIFTDSKRLDQNLEKKTRDSERRPKSSDNLRK